MNHYVSLLLAYRQPSCALKPTKKGVKKRGQEKIIDKHPPEPSKNSYSPSPMGAATCPLWMLSSYSRLFDPLVHRPDKILPLAATVTPLRMRDG